MITRKITDSIKPMLNVCIPFLVYKFDYIGKVKVNNETCKRKIFITQYSKSTFTIDRREMQTQHMTIIQISIKMYDFVRKNKNVK